MKEKKQKISKEYVLAFLKAENIGTLSTVKVSENHNPDAATIHYIIKENFDIFFLTKKETGKFKNIIEKDEVVLTVTNVEKAETVKIKGKAIPLEEDQNIIWDVVTSLAQSKKFIADLDKLLPILKWDGGKIVAVKIEPYEIRLSRYKMESMEEKLFYFKDL